ncbi:MAG: DUF4476 domain-containing protein [Flavobacteriales bacterium]|nr:DUF4476 domain-containing protein [Flavobacteriales bacterium]
MKKLLLLTLVTVIYQFGFTQQSSNLIIFAENATPFYAVVNGIKQNVEPQTNVKITGLTNPANQVKIIFKDPSLPALDKQIYFQEMNVEATMKITYTKKGYKLRYFGEVAMGSTATDPTQNIIVYQTVEPSVSSSNQTSAAVASTPVTTAPVTTTTTVVEETTTVVTSSSPTNMETNTIINEGTTTGMGSENISMNVNMGGFGMNVNINEGNSTTTRPINSTTTNTITSNGNVNYNETSTITTTTTTTTTTSTNDAGMVNTVNSNEAPMQPSATVNPVVHVKGYTGSIGCSSPSENVDAITKAIENESFAEDKLNIAKQATKNKCLTTDQVISICNLFTYEESKLEFAKYAYTRTYDIDDYYKVNSVFTYSSSKDELNEYINK